MFNNKKKLIRCIKLSSKEKRNNDVIDDGIDDAIEEGIMM